MEQQRDQTSRSSKSSALGKSSQKQVRTQEQHAPLPLKRPTTDDPTAWRVYWQTQNQVWRTQPEISLERQEELEQRLKIVPDIEKGIYPFQGMKLDRDDVEWLLVTHDGGGGPVDRANKELSEKTGLDVRGADLCQADLQQLPLTKLCGGLTYDEYIDATEEQRKIAVVLMNGADLRGAQLERADLCEVQLKGADLRGVQLKGADLRGVQLKGADLRGVQLKGADLSEAQLGGADLREAQLEGVNLCWAQLEEANLCWAQLGGAYLIGAQLGRADLFRAQLKGANLSEAQLGGANLYWAQLEGADLSEAQLKGANLSGAQLGGANLSRAQLEGANIYGAQLEGADLSRAQLKGADLREAQLERAELNRAQLEGADLREAQLEGASLILAQLEGADLNGAQLKGASLGGAQLERANLYGAQLEGAFLYGAQLEGADLRGAQLKGADLYRAQLKGANLSGAQLEGANLREVILGNQQRVGPQLADVQWGNTNLAVLDWSQVSILGEEYKAKRKSSDGQKKNKSRRLSEYQAAVRANRQLAVALQTQGLNEEASCFAYHAQRLQRIVLRRHHKFASYLFSGFLDLIAGYGYRAGRAIIWYLLVIVGFAAAYFVFGHVPLFPDALVFSLMSFHGRGFFPSLSGETSLHNQLVEIAAVEAVVGLFIEISFIATFTQRFFGK